MKRCLVVPDLKLYEGFTTALETILAANPDDAQVVMVPFNLVSAQGLGFVIPFYLNGAWSAGVISSPALRFEDFIAASDSEVPVYLLKYSLASELEAAIDLASGPTLCVGTMNPFTQLPPGAQALLRKTFYLGVVDGCCRMTSDLGFLPSADLS